MYEPVPGHPYVRAAINPGGCFGPGPGYELIECQCSACGDYWQHRCEYPKKADLWIYRYAAQHHHGVPGLRERFAYLYHTGLQQLRMTA
jgi:hypothetical protein